MILWLYIFAFFLLFGNIVVVNNVINTVICRYMMAEVVQNIMVPGPKQFSIHILNRDDQPFLLTQKWSSQDKGMFYLFPKAMKDNLSEIVNNVSSFIVYKFMYTNISIYNNNYTFSHTNRTMFCLLVK